jgi:hypothetical protein
MYPFRIDIVGRASIECETLDEVLREAGLTDVDFINKVLSYFLMGVFFLLAVFTLSNP